MSGEDFPRGGSTADLKSGKQLKRKREDDDLFKVEAPKHKKVRIPKSKPDEEIKVFSEIVAAGVLVLGCVREIHDFELVVSLPNSFKGTVAITDISDDYTALLERLAKGTDSDLAEDQSFLSLHDIFQVGSIVRCRVKEVTINKKMKKEIKLTLNPKDVNKNIALKNGMVVTGCVASCEDHGYLIDLGIANVRAFLKKSDAASLKGSTDSDQKKLSVGSYLHCAVSVSDQKDKEVRDHQVVKISIDPVTVHQSLLNKSMKLSVQMLLPGLVAKATVTKVQEHSLIVQMLSFTGTVHKNHLLASLKKYDVGTEIEAAILFVNPITKVMVLTELRHLVSPNFGPMKTFGDLRVGEILEDATVGAIDRKQGIFFKLPNKLKGFAKLTQLEAKHVKTLQKTFAFGSTHRCRIMNFDFLSKMVFLSLKENIINMEFFSYADVKPGSLLECTVEKLLPHGVTVKVTAHIRGYIPKMHLADVPLANPGKKFVPGKKIKCKVLVVDPEKSKLLMTCKKSLIRSELPVITDYEQCKRGLVSVGFVASVKPNGMIVVFYNDVKGWVPKREATDEVTDNLKNTFFVGQVVKCRVVKSDSDNDKMTLSLKIRTSDSAAKEAIPDDIIVGKVLSSMVTNVDGNGLKVEVTNGVVASLPKMHLSDHVSNVELLLSMYRKDDHIKETAVFCRNKLVTLTKKASFLHFAKEENLVNDFSLLQPGMILPGVVKKKMTYGLFVDINGLTGLVPRKFLFDNLHPDPMSLFSEGQSLMPKITEVDREKKRFLLSLRMSDCYHGDTNIGIDLLENYFEEYQKILDHMKTKEGLKSEVGHLTIGSIVDVRITNVNDKGVLCELKNGVKGFATLDNMTGVVCKEEEELKGVILFVDAAADCVQLSLNQDLVKAIKKYDDNKFSKARVGQVIKSEIHLVTSDFVLVLLKGHAGGRLAFLPAKRHLNDLLDRYQYHVGQVNPVVIKRDCGNRILANLQLHETHASSIAAKSTFPELDSIVKAKVLKVYPFQMNITVDGFPGRIHVTEVADDITEGTSPLSDFTEGKEVTVKVIGYREEKTHKYVPSNQARMRRVLLECSLRPSKISSTVTEDILHPEISAGDVVNGFVISINKNCIQLQVTQMTKGTVHILNASNKPKVLSNASSHFKVGCAYKAKVLGINADGIELTLVDRTGKLQADNVVPAIILKAIPHNGLLLQLPHRQLGDVHLTQLSDQFKDFEKFNFKEGRFVKCRILSSGPRNKWIISLRKSKLDRAELTADEDREISGLGDIKQGDICRGFIVSNGDSGFLVSFAPDATGRVKHGHLSKYIVSDLKTIFHVGKVVTAKILSLDRSSRHMELSLLEKDTGVAETVPANAIEGVRLEASGKEESGVESKTKKSFQKLFGHVHGKEKSMEVDDEVPSSDNFWYDKFMDTSDAAAENDDSDISDN